MRWIRCAIAVAIGLAALVVPGGSAPATAQAGRMGINGFTVGDDGSVPSREQVRALADAGAAWVRVEFKTDPFGGTSRCGTSRTRR